MYFKVIRGKKRGKHVSAGCGSPLAKSFPTGIYSSVFLGCICTRMRTVPRTGHSSRGWNKTLDPEGLNRCLRAMLRSPTSPTTPAKTG